MGSKFVQQLLGAARPFLRIEGVERQDWCRNVEKGPRRGPWRYKAVFEVLDNAVWSTSGEVLYLVRNAEGQLRLVGQSSRRLKDRWRVSPMYDLAGKTQIGQALFHSTAWPAIERGFDGEAAPFTVLALFREDLQRELASNAAKSEVAICPTTGKLAEAVEGHILATEGLSLQLWNRAGVRACQGSSYAD